MKPMELLAILNDPDRAISYDIIDKSQVYRWLKGQLPQGDTLNRIAHALELESPTDLLRDPSDDWLREFYGKRTEDEKSRIREMLKIAFPPKKAG